MKGGRRSLNLRRRERESWDGGGEECRVVKVRRGDLDLLRCGMIRWGLEVGSGRFMGIFS